MRRGFVAVVAALALLAAEPVLFSAETEKLSRRERKDRIARLSDSYREFLQLVEPIITPEEVNIFLLLESDAQRDRFIEDFWFRRDPDPKTTFNPYREDYLRRVEEVKKLFRNANSDRGRIYLVSGEPAERTTVSMCQYVRELEIWRYVNHPSLGRATLIFTEAGPGNFKLWSAQGNLQQALRDLLSFNADALVREHFSCPINPSYRVDPVQAIFFGAPNCFQMMERPLILECPGQGERILEAVHAANSDPIGAQLNKVFEPPRVKNEDVGRVLRTSVIADPKATKISGAELSVGFGGRRGERVGVQATLILPTAQLKTAALADAKTYNLDVTGETLKDEAVFETFRYRFDVPAPRDSLSLLMERHLHPATYKIRLKATDSNSGAQAIVEKEIVVPEIDALSSAQNAAATTELNRGARIRILPIEGESLVVGSARVDTIVNDSAIATVEFYLDGRKIMAKRNSPATPRSDGTPEPFSVSLDFGPVPRLHTVRVVGVSAKGVLVDSDELVVNAGADPFRVDIVTPRNAAKAKGSIRIEVEARIPEGKKLRDLVIQVDGQPVATLYGPPFITSARIEDESAIAEVRAIATLTDAAVAPAEDVVFVNTPEHLEQIQVHLVEVPVTALRDSRPVADLSQNAFRLFDTGKQVKIERFEYVKNLPLSVGLAVDNSASMKDRLAEAQRAASDFLQKVVGPDDQAFVQGFDRTVHLFRKWSSDRTDLTAGLLSMRAEEATSLYDAVVSALYQFQGVRGQRALILISDGKDTSSRFTFDQALEYARRAGVPIYAIGLGIRPVELDVRPRLTQLALETGGAAFFINDVKELDAIYGQIEEELRSQYVLAFYPASEIKPGSEWRELRVEIDNAKAKTIRGYYP